MIIQWYGQSCFKIQSSGLTIAIDPYSKEIGLTPPRFQTDILLITHSHFDHSNKDALGGEPFLISGPGEYEVKEVYIQGIQTFHDKTKGSERGLNTMYILELEGIRILHMGDFGEGEIREQTLEEIGDIDILMIPVGGTYTIDAREAVKVTHQIEPRIVIPMHYKIPDLKVGIAGPEVFLKEMGAGKSESHEKLVVKKKDVEGEGKTQVAVLKAG